MNRIIEIEIGCCGDCPYYNWKKHKCDKGATDCGGAGSRFHKDCPLKWREVTKKESKVAEKEYIEREALIDKTSDIRVNGNPYRVIFYDDVILAPAADVEPVQHGKWNKSKGNEELTAHGFVHPDMYICSCCNWSYCCEFKSGFKYCPNCGAKMDKE